jgi:hypothetical protein
MMQGCK